MSESFDRDKVVECMFDPVTSLLIAELEDGSKELSYLAEKSSISEDEVKERFSYLVQHGFVIEKTENNKLLYAADVEKFTQIVEDSENFDGAVDGLTKMDSYLN